MGNRKSKVLSFKLRHSNFGVRTSSFELPCPRSNGFLGFFRWSRWITVPVLLFVVCNAFNAIAQTSLLDVLVVLDQSRSMRQSDPKRMVSQAFSQFIHQLPVGSSAGLVLFGSQAWSVQSLAPLSEDHRRQLLSSIGAIRYADTQSNPAAAVNVALDEFKSRSRVEGVLVMILLTDGGVDTGSKTRDAEIRHLLETQVLAEVRQQKIRIYTIAFTTEADLSLLQKIARESDGEAYLALNPDALTAVFGRLGTALEELVKVPPTQSPPAAETTKPSEGLKQSVASTPAAPAASAAPAGFSRAWLAIGLAGLIGLLAVGGYFFFSLKPKLTRQRKEPVPEASLVDLRTGKPFRIDKTVVQIGRKADNDLVISEKTVSGQHAKIHFRKGKFYLEDLQSANETKVNGLKVVGEVELHSGDVVRFDQFGFTFKGPDAEAERTLLRS